MKSIQEIRDKIDKYFKDNMKTLDDDDFSIWQYLDYSLDNLKTESKKIDSLHKIQISELKELIRIAYKEGQADFKQSNQEFYDFEQSAVYEQVTKYFK